VARHAEEERRRADSTRQAKEEKQLSVARKIGRSVWHVTRWVLFAIALYLLYGTLIIDSMRDSKDASLLVIGLLLAIAVGPYSLLMWRRIGAAIRGAKL
jgi:hypothetical protein